MLRISRIQGKLKGALSQNAALARKGRSSQKFRFLQTVRFLQQKRSIRAIRDIRVIRGGFDLCLNVSKAAEILTRPKASIAVQPS
jgi:hypothetical protein